MQMYMSMDMSMDMHMYSYLHPKQSFFHNISWL